MSKLKLNIPDKQLKSGQKSVDICDSDGKFIGVNVTKEYAVRFVEAWNSGEDASKHKWVKPYHDKTSEGYDVQGPCKDGWIEVNLEDGTVVDLNGDDLRMMLGRIEEAFKGGE